MVKKGLKLKLKKDQLIFSALFLVPMIVGTVFFFNHRRHSLTHGYFPPSITKEQIKIPVYYPTKLSNDYSVGGYKVVKQNVLYYLVTDKNNQKFNINIQPLPANFDLNRLKQNVGKPEAYQVNIGKVVTGIINNTLVASIQTNDHDLIVIVCKSVDTSRDMRTIAESLRLVNL